MLNKVIRLRKRLYWEQYYDINKQNMRNLWDLAKNDIGHIKARDVLPDHFISNGNTIRGDQNMANHINKHFVNIGREIASQLKPNENLDYRKYLKGKWADFDIQKVDEQVTNQIVRNMENKKSSSFDGFSNQILKSIYPTICPHFTFLINRSIETGFIPDFYKCTKVVPLLKKGVKN